MFVSKISKLLLLTAVLFTAPLFAQTVLQADGTSNTYTLITNALAPPKYVPYEVPDQCDPANAPHIRQVYDSERNGYVFQFLIHLVRIDPVTGPVDCDPSTGDSDRQRNEIKTYGSSPAYLKAYAGDTVTYRWKFKLPTGFQVSPNFTHLHQIKAVNGNDSNPVITFTAEMSGGRPQFQVKYVNDANTLTKWKGIDLSSFLGEWVEAYEKITFNTTLGSATGSYSVTIKRVRDGYTLLSYTNTAVDLLRSNTDPNNPTFYRPKWGIYRSVLSPTYLRDESVLFDHFCLAKGTDDCPEVVEESAASMTSPVPGSKLSSSSAQFSWSSVTGVQQYWIWIGTTPGSMDIYNQGQGTNTSATINGLPTNNAPVYVRLFTMRNDQWLWNDYSYTAASPQPAAMINPAAGSTLTGSSATFTWQPVSGAQQYWMWIGTAAGGMELYNQGQGSNTSATVNGLPTNGSPVYVRLFTTLNGQWLWNDYSYTAAAPQPATMVSPAAGSTLTGSSATFTWQPVSGAQQYWIWIGSAAGGMDLYNQGQGTNTSATVTGLPTNGSSVYVRLFTTMNGQWLWNDYVYTAAAAQPATMVNPVPGATLSGSSVTFTWASAQGSQGYWMWIGTTPGGMELYNQGQSFNTSTNVSGLPTDGSAIYVRLFTVLNGQWRWNDYSYTTASQ